MRNGRSEVVLAPDEPQLVKIFMERPPYTLTIPAVQSITEIKRGFSCMNIRDNINNDLVAL